MVKKRGVEESEGETEWEGRGGLARAHPTHAIHPASQTRCSLPRPPSPSLPLSLSLSPSLPRSEYGLTGLGMRCLHLLVVPLTLAAQLLGQGLVAGQVRLGGLALGKRGEGVQGQEREGEGMKR